TCLRLGFVRVDVVLQLLALGIVGFLLQELFVLRRRAVLVAGEVVERRQTQVRFSHSCRIESQRFVQVTYRLRTFLQRQVSFAQEIVRGCRLRISLDRGF